MSVAESTSQQSGNFKGWFCVFFIAPVGWVEENLKHVIRHKFGSASESWNSCLRRQLA